MIKKKIGSYLTLVSWFSILHREVFSGYSGFPFPQKPAFDFICVNCYFQFSVAFAFKRAVAHMRCVVK